MNLEKKIQKKILSEKKEENFGFFSQILIYSFLFVYSDCHLMNIKISLLDMTITRNSLRM